MAIELIRGVRYHNPGPREGSLSRYPDGHVRHGYLDQTLKHRGATYACEIAFWPSGRLRVGRLHEAARILAVQCSSFVYFHESGRLASGKLVEETCIDGIVFKAGQYVDFDEDGAIRAGCLAGDQEIAGTNVEGDRFVKFSPRGRIAAISQGPTWRTWQGPEGYECSIGPTGFNCGQASVSHFGGFGTSCTFRELLQGVHQDFIRAYMPDSLEEIVARCVAFHAEISSVAPYDFASP